MAENRGGPGIRRNDTGQHTGGGGLAGTVRTEETEDLALLDIKRYMVDGDDFFQIFLSGLKHELQWTQAPHLLHVFADAEKDHPLVAPDSHGSHPFSRRQGAGV